MPNPNLTERPPHDEAEELIPWYATGQLDATDRARVERHLYACASCREQLKVERQLIDRGHAPEMFADVLEPHQWPCGGIRPGREIPARARATWLF